MSRAHRITDEDGEAFLVTLDDRRRFTIPSELAKPHDRFLVRELADGTLIFTPAVVRPANERPDFS